MCVGEITIDGPFSKARSKVDDLLWMAAYRREIELPAEELFQHGMPKGFSFVFLVIVWKRISPILEHVVASGGILSLLFMKARKARGNVTFRIPRHDP